MSRIVKALGAVLLIAAVARADTSLPKLDVAAEVRRDLDDPTWIAVDADDLLVISDGRLLRFPRRGGGAPVAIPQVEQPIYAVSDGESLFWTAGHDGHYPIFRMPKSGGRPVELDVGDASRGSPRVLAVDGRWLYLQAPLSPYTIHRVAKSGGRLELLVTGAQAMAIDDEQLYWIGNDWALHRRAKASGETAVVLPAMPRRDISWIAAGSGWIYWLDGFRLMRVARTGGAITVAADKLASDRLPPAYLAARGGAVYSVSRGLWVPERDHPDTSTLERKSAELRRYGTP